MKILQSSHLLYTIILLEGYVVLATELLAIRQLIPFTGSGVEVIAIIISAVLFPLAIGYDQGGHIRKNLRKRLSRNILVALLILAAGQSYVVLDWFFQQLGDMAITHRLAQTAIYATLFLALPVYLLAQTVPIISNYFPRARIGIVTGRILFFSTVGSFLGSIISTLILMNWLGVHYTAMFTLFLLGLLYIILPSRTPRYIGIIIAGMAFIAAAYLNSNTLLQTKDIVSYNAYNLARIHTMPDGDKILDLNRTWASRIGDTASDAFPFLVYLRQKFLQPMAASGKEHEILIIGAGGFATGLHDPINRYTYVDIDPALKDVSEKYFLKKSLAENQHFIVSSGRAFVRQSKEKYDFILLDAYTNYHAIPIEVLSREFLVLAKNLLKSNGVLVMNYFGHADFSEPYDVRAHNTFASVFPVFTRQVIEPFGSLNEARPSNILYIYRHNKLANDRTIYTDDLNTYSLDQR
ncbi:MAG: fused MFS/spermidine synthase [Rickettsiales bacterium]